MKTFRQYRLDEQSNAEINKMLTDYTSGAIEDYDNKGSYMALFAPNGNGLPKLLSNFNLVILDEDNTIYSGKGSLIKTHMDFNLSVDTESTPSRKLHVELAKTDDGDYIIKTARMI